ncbi:CHAT domain-containing protein [Suillus paluster]|uniref:CHAT domain-containing protein n=1 Tax=Suillus paluster TaxID=48578 RepID=UPI001B8679AD|nr:CHAT domain-containing protein [Suillus paluster]KAG1731804.1 CHAT domain-containing protein [Suillus paluster]
MTDAGHCILARYKRTQDHGDLDHAIKDFERASDLCPVDHPYRPAALSNLATAKFVSCQVNGTYLDLDIPISLFQDALDMRPTGHPDRPLTQLHLALALLSRCAKRGFQADADVAKELLNEVRNVSLADSHLSRAALLAIETSALVRSTDANTLRAEGPIASMLPWSPNELADRAELCLHTYDPHAMDEVISLHYDALGYYSTANDRRGQLLCNLSIMLVTRFERRGNSQDLDEAIALQKEALALRPIGHTARSESLNNLANQLSTRFQHRGNDQDLDEAIVLNREALALHPVGHADRSRSLNNLAIQLSTRFQHRGNDQDLDEAVMFHREALALRPVGHIDRSSSLNNLASQLSTRFQHRGNDQDLDEATVLNREALALNPVGHAYRSRSLNNLATQLSTRFQHRYNDQDLDEAIMLHREALALRPVSHTDRSSSLNNLSNQLFARFEHRGNDQDLDEAVMLHREALALRPVGHTDRSSSLDNLASQLSTRFQHRGNDQDLDEAIMLHREALPLRPVGHTYRFMSLNNLATQLSTRFRHRGNDQDLQESLENLRCALTLLTQHDPRQILVRHWVRHADQHSHGTELEAYATSMQLLDAFMSATASVSSRHHIMKEFQSTLAVNAASCALRRGEVCRAVELLEQGRTLIWNQMARFRMPLDSLQDRGAHAEALVKKFRDLSSILDRPPSNHLEGTSRVDVEARATKYRCLVEEWNTALKGIRKIEGFDRFLLAPLFSELQDAARDGPIIVLIASKSSCNAIIVPHKGHPVSVELAIDVERLVRLVNALQLTVAKDSSPQNSQREKQAKLVEALRQLWVEVVHPVVKNLAGVAKPGSRIWWCPTSFFNFLPLHAAGEYRPNGTNLSQLYISSYTPSLTALIKARRHRDRALPVSFAAIGQNRPSGYLFALPCVEPELDLVKSLLPPSPTVSFTKVTSNQSTKSAALRILRDNHWVHFSCHGTQDFVEPFKSAFLMRDEPLRLLDISHTDLSRHEFAFLSACQTAVGDFETPDEAIHLAAGLQFSGVKSVIGTFWNVNDSTVQRLVEAFYKEFCGDGKMNSKRAARALHKAVQSLKDLPLDQRIVFMHIGV